MTPHCPLCGLYVVLETPPRWTLMSAESWALLLVIRHVIRDHPEWLS